MTEPQLVPVGQLLRSMATHYWAAMETGEDLAPIVIGQQVVSVYGIDAIDEACARLGVSWVLAQSTPTREPVATWRLRIGGLLYALGDLIEGEATPSWAGAKRIWTGSS